MALFVVGGEDFSLVLDWNGFMFFKLLKLMLQVFRELGRGVYNIDFDNLEDMNLFQFNIKLGFFLSIIDNVINFFQSRNKLRFFLFFNDCNENQIKIDSEVFVNENLEMDNNESSKENEFLNLKGIKNFYFD